MSETETGVWVKEQYSTVYASLFGATDERPYEDARESDVALRRFATLISAFGDMASAHHQQGDSSPLRILDFGCGDGHTASVILDGAADEVRYYGCDVYPLDQTASRLESLGFSAEVCGEGMGGMPSDWTSFDLVMALSCLQYVPDIEATFAGLASRVRSGGLLAAYFYDAGPMRQVTDAFFREGLNAGDGATPSTGELLGRIEPMAQLFMALSNSLDGVTVDVPVDVPLLGIIAGEQPVQKLLIDYLVYCWAPQGAQLDRVVWASAEMFLTGDHNYPSREGVLALAAKNGLHVEALTSWQSGHLLIARQS